jgi:hypothetical protein
MEKRMVSQFMTVLRHSRPFRDPRSETREESGQIERPFDPEGIQGWHHVVQVDVQGIVVGQHNRTLRPMPFTAGLPRNRWDSKQEEGGHDTHPRHHPPGAS